MYTEEDLQKKTKETLMQFYRSFFEQYIDAYGHRKDKRKYPLSHVIPNRYESCAERESKQKHIQWILAYQQLHPDDPIEFKEGVEELSRQVYKRLTAKKLHELCVEQGYVLGVHSLGIKDDCISMLLGHYPFSGVPRMLTETQKEAFLKIFRDPTLDKQQFMKKIANLRTEYRI